MLHKFIILVARKFSQITLQFVEPTRSLHGGRFEIERDTFHIELDSKENFDNCFASNWYYYYV